MLVLIKGGIFRDSAAYNKIILIDKYCHGIVRNTKSFEQRNIENAKTLKSKVVRKYIKVQNKDDV